jgi:hypothetical protein
MHVDRAPFGSSMRITAQSLLMSGVERQIQWQCYAEESKMVSIDTGVIQEDHGASQRRQSIDPKPQRIAVRDNAFKGGIWKKP